MSLNRLLASASTILLLPLGAVTLGSGAASAADLNFSASPKRVVVNQSYENIRWHVRGSTYWVDSVDVYLEHAATREGVDLDFTFDGQTNGVFKFYDWNRPGRYNVHGVAYDDYYNEMPVARTHLTVKFGSKSTLTANRSGRYVKLRAVTKRYDGGYPLWKAHRKATVTYQRYARGDWRSIARRTVARNGVTNLTVRRQRAAKYRVVVRPTNRVWNSTSRIVRR